MNRHTKEKTNFNLQGLIPDICIKILLIFILFIGLFLSFYSARYSYYSPTTYKGPVLLIKDNVLWNILTFIGSVALSMLLHFLMTKTGERQRTVGYTFLGLTCLLYVIAGLIWVSELPYYPSGDQLNATAAAYYHLNGNFIMLKDSGYLGKFPYQKGLTILYELLFTLFGDFCYPVVARIHIFLGAITLITGYLFIEETSLHSICKLLYCPLFLFCVPYLVLTPYAYGDLPSICFCMVLFWALLRYARTNNKLYVVLCCIMAALSLMVRMHTWVVLIAVCIGMILVSIQKKALAPVLAAALVIVSAFTAIKAVDYSYLLRSGYPSTYGAPMVLTLAMGMQDNEGGPGTYNNYQTTVMSSVDYDRDAASTIATENLQESLEHFADDPDYASHFFKTKLQMQWIEPSFETLLSTHSFDEELPLPEWINEIYYGGLHDPLLTFADRYQSVIYIGFLFFVPVLWKKRKENAACYIPLIAIVGGFLFSIIWESQCRYVLPYYIFMLLYVPDGIWQVSQWIKLLWNRIRKQTD